MELKGKVINFLGDSITEGHGVEDIENNRYDNVIKREYGLKAVNNYGIGGTRFAYQSKPSAMPRHDLYFCGRAFDLDANADVIVVYGGVNDYIHGDAPIGNKSDCTPITFYGATRFLMNFLRNTYVGKPIVFVAPARLYYEGISDLKPSTRQGKREDALPLIGYVNIIKEIAKEYDIPVLDLYNELKINPANESDYANYTADGLHFNDKAHKMLAELIGEFLLKL